MRAHRRTGGNSRTGGNRRIGGSGRLFPHRRVVAGVVALATVPALGIYATAYGDSPGVADHAPAASLTHRHAGAAAAPVLSAAAPADVRLRLEHLLGHHAVLMTRLMRGQFEPRPDFAQAAQAALDRNTEDITAAVTAVYDAQAGEEFKRLWVDHSLSLFNYAKAFAAKDAAGQQQAREALDRYVGEYGNFVERLTGGKLPANQVSAGVKTHIDHLISQLDAYAARDYARSHELGRTAYAHMFANGKGFAAATVQNRAGELPAGFDDPPQQLRSALGQLLGEHMQLTVDASRTVVSGGPDLQAAQAALNANTRDIATAVAGIFDARRAGEFQQLWADHVDTVVDYAVAVADKDTAGQQAARERLDQFAARLAGFLSSVSGGKVAADKVVAAVTTHDGHLMDAISAYANGDYAKAHEITYDGYSLMFAVAGTFATAVEAMQAAANPRGGAATGAGGLAGADAR